jgi:hypothetical protein
MSTPFFTVRSHSVGSTATADVAGTLLLDGVDILPVVTWRAGGLSRTRQGSIEFVRF